VLPHVWHAQTRGFCCFRNAWEGADDIVAQIYAKQGQPCGWNQAEAGCFQIYGLGHEWAWKDNDAAGKTGSRWLDNVVMLPEDPIDAWAEGKVTWFQGDEHTGSGVVSIDLENVYRCLRPTGKKGVKESYDGGIHGLRSFAADYSGQAGVPALFAVVDHIQGGGQKIWSWQLPRDPKAECVIDGNTFTLKQGDASLKATFVGPSAVKIEKVQGTFEANKLSGIASAPCRALHVSSPDGKAGDFFVILTLQRGPAPEVKVKRKGKDVVATVGRQTVRFDGAKVILGK
jgi:hypothetical protein